MTAGPPLRAHVMEVGPLAANAYIVEHVPSRAAVVVDPGDDGEAILREIEARRLSLERILLTHGHFDHVGAVAFLRRRTGVPVCIHPEDAPALRNAARQGLMFGLRIPDQPDPDTLVRDGDLLPFGDTELRVAHTPGHTPGGVSYIIGRMAFVGDLVFAGSIGRTDLPGGSYEQLIEAVRTKIFTLDADTVLLPGHGPPTTVGTEKRTNPFFTGE
jgi:hydroxyacylglutathione hydrolase